MDKYSFVQDYTVNNKTVSLSDTDGVQLQNFAGGQIIKFYE